MEHEETQPIHPISPNFPATAPPTAPFAGSLITPYCPKGGIIVLVIIIILGAIGTGIIIYVVTQSQLGLSPMRGLPSSSPKRSCHHS